MTVVPARAMMIATLGADAFSSPLAVPGMRVPDAGDVDDLARLMFRAYRGTVDDAGESEADALAEVTRTFAGAYGEFFPTCSRVIERNRRLVSATLVTRWQGRPLIAFTMTDPEHKRAGLARACIRGTMEALHACGEREVCLVVTLANEPAVKLYQSLGFQPEEGVGGGQGGV